MKDDLEFMKVHSAGRCIANGNELYGSPAMQQ